MSVDILAVLENWRHPPCTQIVGCVWDDWCQSCWFPTNLNYQYNKQQSHSPRSQTFYTLRSTSWVSLQAVIFSWATIVPKPPGICQGCVMNGCWGIRCHERVFTHWTSNNKQHKKTKPLWKIERFEVSTPAASFLKTFQGLPGDKCINGKDIESAKSHCERKYLVCQGLNRGIF